MKPQNIYGQNTDAVQNLSVLSTEEQSVLYVLLLIMQTITICIGTEHRTQPNVRAV